MSKAENVLKSIEEIGKKQFIPSIGPVKGKIIAEIIKKHKPKCILEIGTLYGYSAILMANLVADDNYGKVVTVEIDKAFADIAKRNTQDAGFQEKIDIIVGNALEVIPRLSYKFDLLFLDAAKDEYLRYLNLAEAKNLIEKGDIVIADNVGVSKNEMLDYLDYVRNSGIYKSETIETMLEFTNDVKDAIEVSIKVVQ
jgi:predicted O-methyltransferase YrrM